MKTKKQAEDQAKKLLNYNICKSVNLKTKIELLKRPKNVEKRIEYFNKKTELSKLSEMYQKRGRFAWSLFKNNPVYFYDNNN